MKRIVTVRILLGLVILLALAIALLAQVGDGSVLTARWALRDLQEAGLTPERHAELARGLERLLALQRQMMNGFFYVGLALFALAAALLYFTKPTRPNA